MFSSARLAKPELPAFVLSLCSLFLFGQASASGDSACSTRPPKPAPSTGVSQLLRLPMQFERNAGQTASQVQFLSRGPGYTLFLTPTHAVLSLGASGRTPALKGAHGLRGHSSTRPERRTAILEMRLLDSNPHAMLQPLEELPGTVNYFYGNDPQHWQIAVPTFAKVKCEQVYSGIDLLYYGNQRQLEYDFILDPHADPGRIRLEFSGARKLEIAPNGDLVVDLAEGRVLLPKPSSYQNEGGRRQDVLTHFVLRGPNEVALQLSAYDSSRRLVIDPQLRYSSYLGGSGDDYASGIAVDSSGNVIVMGDTSSANFPTTNAYRSALAGANNIFVSKINSNGSAFLYSTYLGGSGTDSAGGMAIDTNGNVYLTGETSSPNFPTTPSAAYSYKALNDIFLTKLGPFGTNLLYSTYLGGADDDGGVAVAADNSGNVYVTGYTYSLGSGNSPFPTKPSQAFQTQNGGGIDAFVAKFNTTLSGSASVIYSTFLGGSSDEQGNGISIDSSGNAYVVGEVDASADFSTIPPTPPQSNFPLLNPFQPQYNAGFTDPYSAGTSDGFLTKLNSTGTGLLFSTFLGGAFDDSAHSVTLDKNGRICIVGESDSTNFPVTLTAAQPVIAGLSSAPAPDAYLTIVQTNGTNLYYSTYLGGSDSESGDYLYRFGIAVDSFGLVYITGHTTSFDFPITLGADQTNSYAAADAFVTKINPAVPGPAGIIYSTLLSGDFDSQGGGADNRGTAIAVDGGGNFYVAGITSATNFPATNALDSSYNGGYVDSFVAKFSSPPDLSVAMVPSVDPVLVGSNLTYTIYINNNGRTTFTGVSNFVQFSTNVPLVSVTSSVGTWSTNTMPSGTQLIFNVGTVTNNAAITQAVVIGTQVPQVMTNTATLTSIETPTVEPNTGNNLSTVLSTVRGFADLQVTATASPEPVPVSSNLTYTITVRNKGPLWPASSIILTDALPAVLTLVSATNTFGICDFDTNIGFVFCTFETLTNGASAIVTIVATPITNGIATNLINAEPFEFDSNQANNTASVVSTLTPLADLFLTQTGPVAAYAGSNITYTINLTNAGPSPAYATVLSDSLPTGAAFVSATTSQGSYSQTNGIVTCNLGILASNANARVTITARPLIAGSVTNFAAVTNSGAIDPLLANNSASISTLVSPAADLGISQSANPASPQVTSNITFIITITNRGPSAAPNLQVTDALPNAFGLFSIQAPAGAICTQSNGVITCNLGTVTNGGSAVVSLLAQANLDGSFTNTAGVSSDIFDLNPNSVTNLTIVVVPNPNAPLLKVARSGTNVLLSWATNAAGFSLQSKSNLNPAILWGPVTNVPKVTGTLYFVTNNLLATNRFYRLIK